MSTALSRPRAATHVSKENAEMDFVRSNSRGSNTRALVAALVLAIMSFAGFAAPGAEARIEDFALSNTGASVSTNQAGAHPDFETAFKFAQNKVSYTSNLTPGEYEPWAQLRDLITDLPPGFIGNPAAFPTCDAAVFVPDLTQLRFCPVDSQVGMIEPGVSPLFKAGDYRTPLINLEPPAGNPDVVARLGFVAYLTPMYIDISLDPERENALRATLVNVPTIVVVLGAYNHFWGVPTDHSHDTERFNWFEAVECHGQCGDPVESGLAPTAFMSNPTSCGAAEVGMAARAAEFSEGFDYTFNPLGEIEGCDAVPFEPTMSLAPSNSSAAASSGIDVSLQIPQGGLTDPEGRRASDLRKAVVRLPQGVSLNASAVDGLASCSEEQIGVNRNERQIVDVAGRGAPVALTFDGQTTTMLPEVARPAQVQAALEALPNLAPGDIAVGGRRGGPWIVDFTGAYAGRDVPPIDGVHSELQQLGVSAASGTYTLSYEGETTTALPYGAEAAEVEAALKALPSVTPGELEVTGGQTLGFNIGTVKYHSFHIVFGGPLSGADAPLITTASALVGGNPYGGGNPELFVSILKEGGSGVATHTVKQGGTLGFDHDPPACPESSKIATGEIATPLLHDPLKASVYMASQSDNPFGSLFAGYLVARGQGVMIKVPAKFDVDPGSGQIVATFDNNPQQPFSDLELHFKGGNRGLITTPDKCGTYQSSYVLTPWSGTPPVEGTSDFTIDRNCGPKGFAPGFRAGSSPPVASSYSTFATQVTRDSGTPDLTGVAVDLPPGVTAKLAGIPYCPDAALASVSGAAGAGAAQLAAPSCPSASQVGTVVAGTGSGAPFYVKTGKVYLAGPYKGAPLSLAVVTPAIAGPFDLGNVTVRVAVRLDPATAQVHAVSDPLPTMLHGVPLDLRDVQVLLDRPGFALNPTNCEPEQVTGTISGTGGLSAQVSNRFQVGECAALGFKPKISLRLKGGTARTKNPALTVVLRPRPGDANISAISVQFPRSEYLDQSHLGTVCTRVRWTADNCPKGSIYGTVSATTPLLDKPLRGNVYLRSSNHTLPDLVTDLRGPAEQPIRLEASGRTDSVHEALRNTFEFMPDAPITRVVLKMKGGKKGLLDNSRDICAKPYRARVRFSAHNGAVYDVEPKLQVRCKGGKSGGKKGQHRR
jgi:hypothetical protein